MVGKKSGKALLREEGLERTDNGMKQSSWPDVPMINQKNYYTEYMKRDDQILPIRLQAELNRDRMIRNAKDRDRILARTGDADVPVVNNVEGDPEDEDGGANDGIDPSKIIVVHVGSQNLRIGFASDALPRTIPMAIALKAKCTESDAAKPLPMRQNLEGAPEELFGEDFSRKFVKMCNDLKTDMRANKRKVLPNSKELVVNYNRRTSPEKIPEHNDPIRIEWTDINTIDLKARASFFAGTPALRIPEDSDPKFRLSWPVRHGWLHEAEYTSQEALFDDLESIIEYAMKNELGLTRRRDWEQYNCVFVIPDLYDKIYVQRLLTFGIEEIEFKQVAFIQESLAATYGAGYSSTCVVDIGAQKTSICCVEDGMCHEDSRINLKYGGYDVTETFIKMMLYDHFPYQEMNLTRRYDFLLAEELKINFCTMNQAEISPQLYNFHLRAPSQATRKYQFKTYDEVILAPMGFFDPSIFDNSEKLNGRRSLVPRSANAYDTEIPDDPSSAAQLAILTAIKPSLASATNGFIANSNLNGNGDTSTPQKEKPNPMNFLSRMESDNANGNSRVTSAAGSPAPEGTETPVRAAPFIFGGSPAPNGTPGPPAGMFIDQYARTQEDLANDRDSVLPIAPLDTAIITSISHAARGEDKKARDFFGGIMVIGGGAKTPGLGAALEERLRKKRPDLGEKILVGTSPREMDGQVVAWKGASIFGRLKTHESWIGKLEVERLGSRVLYHKVLWNY